jgi:hypothetical protein
VSLPEPCEGAKETISGEPPSFKKSLLLARFIHLLFRATGVFVVSRPRCLDMVKLLHVFGVSFRERALDDSFNRMSVHKCSPKKRENNLPGQLCSSV